MHPKLHIEDKGDTITIRVSSAALLDVRLIREALAEAVELNAARTMNPMVNANRLPQARLYE